MQLTIKTTTYLCTDDKKLALLIFHGPVDQKATLPMENISRQLDQDGIFKLILDLSDTHYLNSTGLGLLISIAHKVNGYGGGVRLINVPEKFKILFDMLGLEAYIPILLDFTEAVYSFGVYVKEQQKKQKNLQV